MAGRKPLRLDHGDWWHSEVVRFVVLAVLGAIASYFSVEIPYTKALIEGRWIFGYIGFVHLQHWWAALLLAGFLSITRPYQLPLLTVLIGNMLYALPTLIVMRTLYKRWLSRMHSLVGYGVAWLLLILLCAQLFTTPAVWGVLAYLNGAPVWPGILEGWRTQPYLVESLLVGIITALALTVLRSIAALRKSEERFRLAMETNRDGLWDWDVSTDAVYYSPGYTALLGYANDEISPHADAWQNLIHPDDKDFALRANRACIESHCDSFEIEFRMRAKTGEWRWILGRGRAAMRDRNGRATRMIGTHTDITERKRAEEATRKFKKALDASSDAVGMATPDGRHYYQNRTFNEMFGDVGDDPPATLYVDENVGREVFATILAGGEWDGEVTMYNREREVVEVLLRAYAVKEAGEVVAVVGVHTDITDRKRMEAALRESEARNRAILNAIPDMMFVQHRDGAYLDYHVAHPDALYVPPAQFLGRTPRDIFPEPLASALAHAIEQALAANETQIHEYDVFIANEHRYFEARVVPYGADKVLSIIREITERKRAEAERARLTAQIHDQAQKLEQILATVPAGVMLLNSAGRVLQANPVAERDLAVLADAGVGDVLTHLGDHALSELLTSPPTQGLWHEVQAEGRIFKTIARPVERGAEPGHWVLVFNDVTQEREIRTQLHQQERLAAVGQLAAGIAHDFNNIMTSIVLYARMIERSPGISAQDRDRLAVVNQQAWHASRLIEQILDFSRRAILERRPLDLQALVKEQVKLLERTLPENIEIELMCDAGETYTVNADPTRMQQILTNLAVNARDAMPTGGTLCIGLEQITLASDAPPILPGLEGGTWVKLSVADSGMGIAPEVLPHIFEPFFTTKGPGGGSGLGLPQVYGIVKKHAGHINVTTKVGKGAVFTIYLPALVGRQPEALQASTLAFVNGKGETLLVVEDNITLRRALVECLASLEYEILEAGNGHEALDILAQRAADISLVLSDLVMPEMGGQGLFYAMQKRAMSIPVVVLSGHPMEKELEKLQSQGLSGWMLKPPNMEQLSQLLARVLDQNREG